MVFGGGGSSGVAGTLYLTAGGGNQPNFPAGGSTTSVFAGLVPAATVSGPNFSLSLSSQSLTIMPGGSASDMISAAGVGGFNSPISLSCSSSAGLTCAFNPSTITPGSSTGATLTVSAASTPPVNGYGFAFLLPGLGLFGTALVGRKKLAGRKGMLAMKVMGLVIVISALSLFAVGCGSSNSSAQNTSGSHATLTITGTSGSLTQSSALTINIQ
jgi:hypothetical protein